MTVDDCHCCVEGNNNRDKDSFAGVRPAREYSCSYDFFSCGEIAKSAIKGRFTSEIVILTLRGLHSALLAIGSIVALGSLTSSSSHRRPRAMAAISSARLSERRDHKQIYDSDIWGIVPQKRTQPRLVINCCLSHRQSDGYHSRLVCGRAPPALQLV